MNDDPPLPILQHVPFPSKLELSDDANRKKDWQLFRQIWENYEISSQLKDHPKERRTATLLTCFQPSALQVYNSLSFQSEEDKVDIDKVLERMSQFCNGVVNETYERYLFNTRCQEANESIDDFYGALLALSKNCSFDTLTASLIRDRLIVGMKDSSSRQRLLQEKALTLEKCLEIARSFAATKARMRDMQGKSEVNSSVSRVKQHTKQSRTEEKKTFKPARSAAKESTKAKKCYFCGSDYHQRKHCPAKDIFCGKCHKKGHYKAVCKSTPNSLHEIQDDYSSDENETLYMGSVSSQTKQNKWYRDIKVDDIDINFKVDTGADVDVISEKLYTAHFKHKVLMRSTKRLLGADNKALPILGYMKCTISTQTKQIQSDIYVLKGGTALIGRQSSELLDIVTLISNIESDYPQIFQGLGEMAQPYKIELDSNARPYAVAYPRQVALPLKEPVKKELDKLEALGVIERITVPTDWCSPMVVVPKSDNNVRICVDYTRLNEAVKRERHILPTVDLVLAQMAGATVFSKVDANSGFHQIKLTEDSKHLTTFITPFGRYCYNRLPFGINSGPEHFQAQLHRVLENQPGVACLIDDTVVYGKDKDEHDRRLKEVLDKLAKANITLNKSKCRFSKPEITFLGHIVGKDGIKPEPTKVSAVINMQTPLNISELRRFLGMVNQLGKFLPNLASITEPLRGLLITGTEWTWDSPQQQAFEQIKCMLTSSPVLALYDPNLPTKVTADSSSYGLGAVLTQQHPDGNWHPVVYASRTLTKAERGYAQIEKESLACTWACSRFQNYLIGLRFTLETDHKPLIPLLGTAKTLDELTPRVQRMKMRLMRFNYEIVHVPGKLLYTADTLSRAPNDDPLEDDYTLSDEVEKFVISVIQSMPATDTRLEQIRQHQQEDDVCQTVIKYVKDGWPDKDKLKGILKLYWSHRSTLTVEDGLLLNGIRIVIPPTLRQDILSNIHEGHQGITKCRRRAIQSVWWPGVSSNIKELVDNCSVCSKNRRNHPEPLISTSLPGRPWQKVAADVTEFKKEQYLVVIDYYSRYIELARLERMTSKCVIRHMKSIFSRHGVPETLISDNGTNFVSAEFNEFASDYGFNQITCSPKHSSGNGEVERAVRTVKELLYASDDPYGALLSYRSTPLANGYSPAELLMSRKLRTKVPVLPKTLESTLPDEPTLRNKEESANIKQQFDFNLRHSAKPLPALKEGEKVWIKDRQEDGTVRSQVHDRSYLVDTPTCTLRRNRIQLNKVPTSDATRQTTTETTTETTETVKPTEQANEPIRSRYGRIINKPIRFQ